MSQHVRFKFKDKEELILKISQLGVDIPFSDDIQTLFQPVKIGSKKTINRFVIHPMEGFDADGEGSPGDLALRRYKRYAAGGSGLIWFEATAVVAEGRSNPHQFYMHKGNLDVFKRLVDATRQSAWDSYGEGHAPLLILQLTHSGRYSKPFGSPEPVVCHHSRILDPLQKIPEDYPLIADDELRRLQDRFVDAAKLAEAAGFDGVDIKACHGYLVSELLASFTRENSRYGGSIENRTRFLRETAGSISDRTDSLIITSRMNVFDAVAFPYGFGMAGDGSLRESLDEPKVLLEDLHRIGFPLISITISNPRLTPHLGRPYDLPVAGQDLPDEHPLVSIARLIRIAGEMQASLPSLPVVGTGYSWLRQFFPNVAAGVVKQGKAMLIGQGRGAFAYPDSVRDLMENGRLDPGRVCTACSGCTELMRGGGPNGCVIRDKAVYGPVYRRMRRGSLDNLIKEAERLDGKGND